MKNYNANIKSVVTTLVKDKLLFNCKYGYCGYFVFFSFSLFKTTAKLKLKTNFDLTHAR